MIINKVPAVKGLEEYILKFPNRIIHSKSYRSTDLYINKQVIVVGNSASGHDITTQLVKSGKLKLPLYQSRRLNVRSSMASISSPDAIITRDVSGHYTQLE